MNRILLSALLIASSASAQQHHLFLDAAFITESKGTALHVNPPQRREIVITPDKPWEQLMISFYCSVLDDGGKLRLWYICRDKANHPNVAYAESTDGVTWTKPNLGIVEYEGSKDNNLVGITSLEGNVFKDPNAPPEQRYVYITHLITQGMVRFYSADGLHWKRDIQPLLKFGADSQNVTLWDASLGKYVMYLRGWRVVSAKEKYRVIVRAETPSITTPFTIEPSEKSWHPWGKDKNAVIGDDFPTVFAADENDPPNSDVYNLSAVLYPLADYCYLGFPSMFQRDRHMSDGRLEVQFIASTDGIHWQRYDRAPYAPLGLDGSDSANMTFMGTGLVVRGDELWQYGTGFRSRHGDKEARQQRTDGVIYRHVQRVDGFVSLDFDNAGGRAVTQPVKLDGKRLLLNLDTGALGAMRVGLLDDKDQPIPGFNLDDCQPLRLNSTHAEVSWQGADDLSSLAGQEVKLVLQGSRAKVFSFKFAP